jgi:hypothetical protein
LADKKKILDENEAKSHTLVGDLYTKTSSIVSSTPLVGDTINMTHGLFKKTLGSVDTLTKKIGLKKTEADVNGVKTLQWYETK